TALFLHRMTHRISRCNRTIDSQQRASSAKTNGNCPCPCGYSDPTTNSSVPAAHLQRLSTWLSSLRSGLAKGARWRIGDVLANVFQERLISKRDTAGFAHVLPDDLERVAGLHR